MKVWSLIFLSFVVFRGLLAAQPFSFIIAGSDSLDANSSSLAPFSLGGSRYQQVYSSVYFQGPTPRTMWISNIAFRVDASGPGWQGTYSHVQIHLSTTQTQPNSLSPVFANNIGPNDTVVFDGSWSGTVFWPSSPGSLSLRFDLSQGFFYNPTEGNLLLDIQNLGTGIFPSRLDASQGLSDFSSVSSTVGGPSGTPDDLALVTQFDGLVVPVPEPSTYALIALGAGVFLFLRKTRS